MADSAGGGRPRLGWRRLLRPVFEIPFSPLLVGLTIVDYGLVAVLLLWRRVTPPLAGTLVVFSLVAWWFAAWFYPFFDNSHARGPYRARVPIAVSRVLSWFAWGCLVAVHVILAIIGLVGL